MRVPAGGRVSSPRTSVRNSARNNRAPKSRTPSRPHLLSTNQTEPKLATARPKKIQAIGNPPACSNATNSEPTPLKGDCSTLPPAITRARSVGADQAWTAAKDGTTNRPPPNANAAKSISVRNPENDAANAAG